MNITITMKLSVFSLINCTLLNRSIIQVSENAYFYIITITVMAVVDNLVRAEAERIGSH